ncbi:putative FtsX-related transmembrane transport protein [Fulvivirga imtechensis AK7]|uniref:Putative FtsX-related transmembrane transport protein n=1 Tax=Fulvivirga imtechensis AK7 TaxID=1237149 RepID=L8JPF0_9BACT|nr:ABC transporter permease [Fulvivirga imtechensis]ELR70088.1 putative FtsX-related transmembrane transport protein [Fulvivirga imtechensis AK7]
MLKNYIKIALRNILRDKYHAGINIFGLGIGMACAMLVILYVHRELSYDKHFSEHDKIYRISTKFFGIGDFAGGSRVLASSLREQSWVKHATKVTPMGPSVIKCEDIKVRVNRVSMVDSSFFQIFDYPFVEGASSVMMTKPNTIVINRDLADKLFGDQPAVGKLITFDGQQIQYEITGVFDDSEMLTHLKSDIYMANNDVDYSNPWWNIGPMTYIKVNGAVSKREIEQQMKDFVKSTIFPEVVFNADVQFEDWYPSESGYRFYVFPLADIYFDAKLKFEPFTGGDFTNIIIFSVTGFLIVAIAGFNFINLSTAQAIRRATEVGIRKTLGSGKWQLISQFMMESMVIILLAIIFAMGLTELLIILSNSFVGTSLDIGIFTNLNGLMLLLTFALIVGVLSAAYPSFYLSRFSPSRVMQVTHASGRPGFLRNILVVLQFATSIALIIGSLVIYQQLDFVKNKDLGFDQENSIIIKNLHAIPAQEELRKEVLNISGVVAASITDRTPGDQGSNVFSLVEDGKHLNFEHMSGDADLVPILELMVVKGRNFDRERKADTAAVILNQQAVELLGLTDPVGQIFDDRFEIIGVVSDFHFKSIRDKISPLLLFNRNNMHPDENTLLVKTEKNVEVQSLLKNIESLWHKRNSEAGFEYAFLDQNYEKMLEKDKRLAKAMGLLTCVAIILSLLGLTGLCSYTVERKTKEIGIRKVLGASWQNIVTLLSRQFVRLVLIAFILSVPVAWYFADMWLADFAYHIELQVWVFIAGAVLAIIPTWLLISLQSVNAAKANPVDSLRNE